MRALILFNQCFDFHIAFRTNSRTLPLFAFFSTRPNYALEKSTTQPTDNRLATKARPSDNQFEIRAIDRDSWRGEEEDAAI